MSSMAALRELVTNPSNRPAFKLLGKATLMMATFPIATYFLCFEYVFAKGGLYDLSEDFNLRVNFSGFCAIFVVQICIGTFVLMAFQQDEQEIANEKKAKDDLIQKMKDERAEKQSAKSEETGKEAADKKVD